MKNFALIHNLIQNHLKFISECILDELIRTSCLQESDRDNVRHVLSRRHTHQYEQVRVVWALGDISQVSYFQARNGGSNNGAGQGGFLNAVRSISDIGKSFSHGKNLHKTGAAGTDTDSDGSPKKAGAQLELPKASILLRNDFYDLYEDWIVSKPILGTWKSDVV